MVGSNTRSIVPASCSGIAVKGPSAPCACQASLPITMSRESTVPSLLNVVMAFDSSGLVTTTVSYDLTPFVLVEVRYESAPGMPPLREPRSKDGMAPAGRLGIALPSGVGVGWPSTPATGVGVGVAVVPPPPHAAMVRIIGRSSAAPRLARVGRVM